MSSDWMALFNASFSCQKSALCLCIWATLVRSGLPGAVGAEADWVLDALGTSPLLPAAPPLRPVLSDRTPGGRQGTLWYHRRVVEILKEVGTSPLVEELDRAVGELEELVGQGPQESA